MINHTFGAARCARCIVERKALPFIARHDPWGLRIAARQKCLILHMPARGGEASLLIGHLNDLWRGCAHSRNCRLNRGEELAIDQNNLRLPMLKNIGQRVNIEPRVDRVQNSATCRHAKAGFNLCRDIGEQGRNHIARLNAQTG